MVKYQRYKYPPPPPRAPSPQTGESELYKSWYLGIALCVYKRGDGHLLYMKLYTAATTNLFHPKGWPWKFLFQYYAI